MLASTVSAVDASAVRQRTFAALWLARYGQWLQRNTRILRTIQWLVVVVYAVLILVPAFLPLPGDDERAMTSLTVFAQWAFWGLWWPFVILSMFVAGRTWCGVFCPEGTLTEAMSSVGLGRAVPRWLKWAGWPFVAFALTTVFGQLVSVYQYPQAVLLVLGGSTLAAMAVGYVYGREKRVWCRHLCPVNGVFAVLTRVAPMHFGVDRAQWTANAGHMAIHPVNCAPMVRIRRMTGPSECHMCGRCSGHLDAVWLAPRAPNSDVTRLTPEAASRWDAVLIVVGMIGIAIGAFQWSASRWFVFFKSAAAEWIVDHGPLWLLDGNAPWWLLTHYPENNDVFTWLDGVVIVGYITVVATVLSVAVFGALGLAARALPGARMPQVFRLSYALIPLAGFGVFLGLTTLTATLAKAEGIGLGWLPYARAAVLTAGSVWSVWLAWQQLAQAASTFRRIGGVLAFAAAVGVVVFAWGMLFFGWGAMR